MAERVGFEPTELRSSQLFESCTINHSDISPCNPPFTPWKPFGIRREKWRERQQILLNMIIEKSLEINTFSRFGFRKSIRISSPICSVDSSGLNVRTNRIQRKPTKTIIIPTFLLNSHQNRGEKQERKLERKTAERQISQPEKALQHKGFSDWTILLDNTISNPFFHPEPSGQQNHIFNPRNMGWQSNFGEISIKTPKNDGVRIAFWNAFKPAFWREKGENGEKIGEKKERSFHHLEWLWTYSDTHSAVDQITA